MLSSFSHLLLIEQWKFCLLAPDKSRSQLSAAPTCLDNLSKFLFWIVSLFSTSPFCSVRFNFINSTQGKRKKKSTFDYLGRGISLVCPDIGPFDGTKSFWAAIHPEGITLWTINNSYASWDLTGSYLNFISLFPKLIFLHHKWLSDNSVII